MEVPVTSPWVPREWIRAHGLEPRGAWFAPLDPSGAVPEGVCAFAGAMTRLHQAQPHAGIVFTTACDQMRRAADATASSGGKHAFLFSLPATWQTSAARKLYHAEVARLGKYLESLGGHTPGEEELMREIRRSEAHRAHRRRILEAGSSSDRGVPLALVGGPLLPSQWSLFDAVEVAGGRVVLNATEPGERSVLPPLPPLAPGQEAVIALADHYFDHAVDVFHRPNTRLYAWLGERLKARGARGILLWAHLACDLWRVEAASLREAFGLPVLVLEAHRVGTGGLRDRQRLGAFVESRR